MNDDTSDSFAEVVRKNWEDYERDRGILTDTDRQFLFGVKTYGDSRQTRSERRRIIRDRFQNGILDLELLWLLDDRTREKLFDELHESAQTDASSLRSPLSALIEFLYVGLDGDTEWIQGAIAVAIHRGEERLDTADRFGRREVEVNIDVKEGYDLDRIEESLNEGRAGELSVDEIGALVREGRIDSEDLEKLDMTSPEGDGYVFGDP